MVLFAKIEKGELSLSFFRFMPEFADRTSFEVFGEIFLRIFDHLIEHLAGLGERQADEGIVAEGGKDLVDTRTSSISRNAGTT